MEELSGPAADAVRCNRAYQTPWAEPALGDDRTEPREVRNMPTGPI